ncbi:MAG TPA: alpha/beta hydrolase [Acidimicrobiales bacterium]|jgi:pimeloyl-ACP methyl ester carboxylesterase
MIRLPRLPTPGVSPIEPPSVEGVVRIDRRRVLGYAEFGDPDGKLVLWHHGTPGGRRQVPVSGRRAAEQLGVRLVCVERPGAGDSTDHRYSSFADWAADAAAVADHLGHEEFAVVGLSGGGPYALACAHELPDRVTAVGLLGSVCPVIGPDAAPGASLVALSARFQTILEPLRSPLGFWLWMLLQPMMPLGHYAYGLFADRMPEGDRQVFADPDIEAMFIDDIVTASRRQFSAFVHDAALFGRPWGFDLAAINTPVFWWHGDADTFVPLAHAEHSVGLLNACQLSVRPGESHLGGFAAADLVLETLMESWTSSGGSAGDAVRT